MFICITYYITTRQSPKFGNWPGDSGEHGILRLTSNARPGRHGEVLCRADNIVELHQQRDPL